MSSVLAVVATIGNKVIVASQEETRQFKRPSEAATFLREETDGAKLLGIMGGAGQGLFVRAVEEWKKEVHLLPFYRLGLKRPESTPKEWAQALLNVWISNPGEFYTPTPQITLMGVLRALTRVRVGIQDSFRKPAQLKFYTALRTLRYFLPGDAEPLLDLIEEMVKNLSGEEASPQQEIEKALKEVMTRLSPGRRELFAPALELFAFPQFIVGALNDEKNYERVIAGLVKRLPMWGWTRPSDGSSLPAIKGFGPVIAASILSEIGDVERFPSYSNLRAYARFHVTKEGGFPYSRRGKHSRWNKNLHRAAWLWSTDQMPRWDHMWRDLYHWRKAKECQAHPEPVDREIKDDEGKVIKRFKDFTMRHIDSRAKRWVGSMLLEYLFELWRAGLTGDPELWYPTSRWPEIFARARQELNAGLRDFLAAEIARRRKVEPKEEEEEGEEDNV